MKTIFITIFQAVEAKNTIRTPLARALLADPDVRIVFLTQDENRVMHYAREFVDEPRVTFIAEQYPRVYGLDRFFSKLKFLLLRTPTTTLLRWMLYELHGNPVRYWGAACANFLFARAPVRRVVRALDYLLVSRTPYDKYFDEYKPDIVVLLHLFDDSEIHLLREARRRGVPTVGFINSWDKTTSRCTLRLLPDKAIVFNQIVRHELMEHNEMRAEDIFVSGVPQYDIYFTEPPISRNDFFSRLGLNPRMRLILFSVMGEAFSNSDDDILRELRALMDEGRIPDDVVFLVRFMPCDAVDRGRYPDAPRMRYEFPGVRFSYTSLVAVDWDMPNEEIVHLRDTLAHMEILVCYTSSLSIEAAIFDKPVININFEVGPKQPMAKSPTQFFEVDHYRKALATGAIRIVSSREELALWINHYLAHPEIDREGRERLVREQCVYSDGRSGERIARFLLDTIEAHRTVPRAGRASGDTREASRLRPQRSPSSCQGQGPDARGSHTGR